MMKRTVRLVLTYAFFGAVGGVALLWLGASAYFLIAGRDIAPPDLSAYQLPHPKLQPAEDAYTYMKEYARGVKTIDKINPKAFVCLRILNATGEAWFDGVKLEEIGSED